MRVYESQKTIAFSEPVNRSPEIIQPDPAQPDSHRSACVQIGCAIDDIAIFAGMKLLPHPTHVESLSFVVVQFPGARDWLDGVHCLNTENPERGKCTSDAEFANRCREWIDIVEDVSSYEWMWVDFPDAQSTEPLIPAPRQQLAMAFAVNCRSQSRSPGCFPRSRNCRRCRTKYNHNDPRFSCCRRSTNMDAHQLSFHRLKLALVLVMQTLSKSTRVIFPTPLRTSASAAWDPATCHHVRARGFYPSVTDQSTHAIKT